MEKRAGFTLMDVGFIALILALVGILGIVIATLYRPWRTGDGHRSSAQNNRQIALAGIMYGGDYDDALPVTTNGWLCRMQNIPDNALTKNCPAPGTQDLPANDAAGAERTDAWPLLVMPYIKSRGLYVDPGRGDAHNIWSSAAKAANEKDY